MLEPGGLWEEKPDLQRCLPRPSYGTELQAAYFLVVRVLTIRLINGAALSTVAKRPLEE